MQTKKQAVPGKLKLEDKEETRLFIGGGKMTLDPVRLYHEAMPEPPHSFIPIIQSDRIP